MIIIKTTMNTDKQYQQNKQKPKEEKTKNNFEEIFKKELDKLKND